MPNLGFCNTSHSKTSFLRPLSLPKIIKFRSEWPFSHLQKCDHKTEQLQRPILMKFGSKRLPKLEGTFSFWGSEHHFFGFHIHICLQSDFLRMSQAKSLFLPPQGELNCFQKSIKSMVPHLFFKIFSKRSSTRFLKDVPSKSITFASNVTPKLNPKSCRQLQTQTSLSATKISAENKKLRFYKRRFQLKIRDFAFTNQVFNVTFKERIHTRRHTHTHSCTMPQHNKT